MEDRHPSDEFTLSPPGGRMRSLAVGWLALALASLLIGGFYAVPIVLSGAPGIQEGFPWSDLFPTALVLHADLTTILWLLSFAAVLWTIDSTERCRVCGWAALALAAGGTLAVSAAPFLGAQAPLTNSYVPLLRHPAFLFGLAVFGLGYSLLVLRGLLFSIPIDRQMSGEGALSFGLYTALLAGLIAILAFAWSYSAVPAELEDEYYFEHLFWGSGQVMQLAHTQLMLVAWLCLATASRARPQLSPRVAVFLFALGFAPTLATPVIYLAFDVASPDHGVAFFLLMKYGAPLAALPVGMAVLLATVTAWNSVSVLDPLRGALLFSVLLFGTGGAIGFLIGGSDLSVSAHFHGTLAAVTLAYMGLTYHLLPRLGFRDPVGRLVSWQPVVYGGGQLLHLLGLAWTGVYGAERKGAGTAQALDGLPAMAGMGITSLGGLLAVIGGAMYLIVAFRAMRRFPNASESLPTP